MKESKLIKILKSLSPVELNDFGEFVCSPYFNKSEKLITLYQFLKRHYPDFKDERAQMYGFWRNPDVCIGAG